ncbi:hypothetical protein [Ahrensia sp. R2A130]|uniref:hypothetical protein n=1 Tax=Ahrensia sp. R2A130 TaxID=744979 RepID=UPI0001E0F05B|nr:hypothetical protein [Ahrensia sp. R2A130]EFL90977.1 conserved hypothetical protein [Ahrensia sp. R2A130]
MTPSPRSILLQMCLNTIPVTSPNMSRDNLRFIGLALGPPLLTFDVRSRSCCGSSAGAT